MARPRTRWIVSGIGRHARGSDGDAVAGWGDIDELHRDIPIELLDFKNIRCHISIPYELTRRDRAHLCVCAACRGEGRTYKWHKVRVKWGKRNGKAKRCCLRVAVELFECVLKPFILMALPAPVRCSSAPAATELRASKCFITFDKSGEVYKLRFFEYVSPSVGFLLDLRWVKQSFGREIGLP